MTRRPPAAPRRPHRPRKRTAWCELHGGCEEEATALLEGLTIDERPVRLWGCTPHADQFEARERHAPFDRKPSPFLDATPPPA